MMARLGPVQLGRQSSKGCGSGFAETEIYIDVLGVLDENSGHTRILGECRGVHRSWATEIATV